MGGAITVLDWFFKGDTLYLAGNEVLRGRGGMVEQRHRP